MDGRERNDHNRYSLIVAATTKRDKPDLPADFPRPESPNPAALNKTSARRPGY